VSFLALALRQPKRVYPRMPKSLPLLEQYPLYALSFDGVDDYMTVPSSASLNLSNYTIELWFAPYVTGSLPTLLSKGPQSNTDGYWWILMSSDLSLVSYQYAYGTGHSSVGWTVSIVEGKWYLLDITVSGESITLYVNGVSEGTKTASGKIDETGHALFFGGYLGTRYLYKGLIDEVRVYNRALSQAEIQRNVRNPLNPIRDGLVLFLPMVEGVGTVVRDFSGYGNNGTLYNGVSWRELAKYEVQTL
jgi:hypothetical protein